jgi:hypothetical protein
VGSDESALDPIAGRRLHDPGRNLALRLCFEADEEGNGAPEGWADGHLQQCGLLAEAEVVAGQIASGVMRSAEGDDGTVHAWVAGRRTPASWRERADVAWWADRLAEQYPSNPVAAMVWQLPYPDDAILGGCSVRTYRVVLRWLIARAPEMRNRGEGTRPVAEADLAQAISVGTAIDLADVERALSGLTLSREAAAWHAAVPGIAAAPLVRLNAERLVLSFRGLTTQPLLFLARELRRRDPEGYNNAAVLREEVFHADLYGLFRDQRFVTSHGRIQLKRKDASLRTDVDAAVFDKKTGTLALIELKSPDPFARSAAELARQRDNVRYANRQVAGVLDWVKRHGPNAILERVDRRTAKTFQAQRVLPFVLGRTLVRFDDGPATDARAAWGTWPGVVRALGGEPARGTDTNP